MSVVKIDTVFNIDLEFELAKFHKRIFAYFIDFFLMIVYIYAIKELLYDYLNLEFENNIGLDILLISLPLLLYSLILEIKMNGQTIGKRLIGIRVISLNGGEPTFGQFVLRWITKFFEWPFLFGYIIFDPLSIFLYGYITSLLGIVVVIIIGANNKKQRLGDIAAGTVLVNTKSKLSIEDTIFLDISNTDYKVMFPEVMRLSDRDINTIKNVLTQSRKSGNFEMCNRVLVKVKGVLKIESDMYSDQFLEKLLEDYNYLATKE